ncbi:rhamnulokinase [Arthrobacter stackebrandtii]|uniref:Rhamnulokinase n=1 Tax=Arthrobacter stackebrandtii TaxID=272161 RepID=A0ABS4YUA1_9MICC|nr:rhamnulokinase family protein [Arthrobacter stackebrandtii]MBP2412366.1 rhamnulokinase [Arthrobacter stackebrandtii]PYH02140.1 rhamnulokinase [Arthrobacter stackebrandtii]
MSAAPAAPATALFAAVDIGASSGRVIVGGVGGGTAELHVVHRFPNGVVEREGALHWDFDALFAEVLTGLRAAADHASAVGGVVASIGIDTWAVDYGLVDAAGTLQGPPFSYRDGRGATQVGRVHGLLGPERLYETTGLQHLPFNTVFQLAAEQAAGRDLTGLQALLIPDLIAFKLTGNRRTESTNASTTGLYDAVAGEWATEFLAALGLPDRLFPPLIEPGETIGTLRPDAAARTGLPGSTPVVAVGSHDTASAVAAVPADGPNFAYISSGTWSLVGVELDAPVLAEASRAANFTNERGVDGTTRYLRNVGGLWLLSESIRSWEEEALDAGSPASAPASPALSLAGLLAAAAAEPAGGPLIDVDSEAFIAPGNMPNRIRAAVSATGGRLESRAPAVVRCILDSLAASYARTVRQAQELSGRRVEVIHIVGGGSQNELLCQITANSTGLPVVAGPVEATALGNVLVQARAAGAAPAALQDLRAVVAASHPGTKYFPGG